MTIEGSAALVTGGSNGIGQAMVRQLREAGSRVAVFDREAREGEGDVALVCDVTDEKAVVEGVAAAAERLGGLDFAFLNAGVGALSPLLDMTADEWDDVHDVNLRGAFLCLRECAKAMVASGTGGSIVITGSVSGFLADRNMAHYNTSKAGVVQLARIAAAELGPRGIRVNVVAPGTTDTPLFARTDAVPGYREAVSARTPLGGIGSADDVAAAAIALAGLRWVTGQVLVADGGVSLYSPIDIAEFIKP
jgi:NAD(P)-dependent dehydrogenase (short-subunit alcohol dehydrogenase family)